MKYCFYECCQCKEYIIKSDEVSGPSLAFYCMLCLTWVSGCRID